MGRVESQLTLEERKTLPPVEDPRALARKRTAERWAAEARERREMHEAKMRQFEADRAARARRLSGLRHPQDPVEIVPAHVPQYRCYNLVGAVAALVIGAALTHQVRIPCITYN